MDEVETILKGDVNVNGRVPDAEFPGQTPLVWAVRLGKFRCVELLLENGADPFIPDDKHRDAW